LLHPEAVELEAASTGRGGRRQRFPVEQKRRIVEATLAPGASVARVAREFGVNANQVFAWRRAYKQGLLEDRGSNGVKLLPVQIASEVPDEALSVTEPDPSHSGAIHMEFPGKALLTVEGTPYAESLRIILEHLLR
jgi:transposase